MKDEKENHESWEVMEKNNQQINQLLRKYIGRMYGSLEAASIKHFLETGVISGSFRLNLVRMIFDPLLNSDKNVKVSDTTEDHSSNADGVQKILSDFGKRISGEAKSKTPLTEEAFKEELEKQYPLQGMKPNRFRQQGANWSFTNYITPLLQELEELKQWKESAMKVMPDFHEIGKLLNIRLGESVSENIVPKIKELLSELAEAKKEIERLKSQLDGILKQEFGE